MHKVLVVMLLLVGSSAAAQQNFDTVRIRPLKVRDNLYLFYGSGGNIGVMTGRDGTLLIDTQYAPLSNKINGAVKTIDPAEIRFVINTHIHGDHTGGNDNFHRMGATLIAHDNVRDRMSKVQEIPSRNVVIQPRDRDALPVVTFAEKMNLHWNDEDITLVHLGNAHTDGDIIVVFNKANVVHTGDTFVRGRYPFIDTNSGGSFSGFVAHLDLLLGLMNDQTAVIPGHGALATKADVQSLRDKLVDIRDQVLAALKKGKPVEEIPGMGITDKYDAELGGGFVKGKDFVLLAAQDLQKTIQKTVQKKK